MRIAPSSIRNSLGTVIASAGGTCVLAEQLAAGDVSVHLEPSASGGLRAQELAEVSLDAPCVRTSAGIPSQLAIALRVWSGLAVATGKTLVLAVLGHPVGLARDGHPAAKCRCGWRWGAGLKRLCLKRHVQCLAEQEIVLLVGVNLLHEISESSCAHIQPLLRVTACLLQIAPWQFLMHVDTDAALAFRDACVAQQVAQSLALLTR
mmetsp:Transcript_933/g.2295  ORF Transcript_933/g.2295 Transcript_933/m.2295 type:complete len:206 (+) Transcript_933:5338-5955(+)